MLNAIAQKPSNSKMRININRFCVIAVLKTVNQYVKKKVIFLE